MSKKKILVIIGLLLFAVLVNIYICRTVKPVADNGKFFFSFSISSDKCIGVQVFYANGLAFNEDQSVIHDYLKPNVTDKVTVAIPIDTKYIRIDFGDIANTAILNDINICIGNDTNIDISLNKVLNPQLLNYIDKVTEVNGSIYIKSQDVDPYIVISIDDINLSEAYRNAYHFKYLIFVIVLCVAVDILILLCIRHIKLFVSVPLDIYHNRDILWDLVKNDFQARFAGSYFGVFWAFVQPVITMLLYWFVFQVGLRSGNVSDYPFILFLMSGLIPWFYFSEAWSGATNTLIEYSYLVKKVVFEVRLLPVVKTISSIFVHVFFVAFLVFVCIFYGFTPDLYILQLIYYIICSCCLVLGLSYITSACTVFFRDTTQIINIILTVGVWLTPIMWNPIGKLPPVLLTVFQLNPMYYIVDGFRDTLLAKRWFWDKPVWTTYFWIFSIVVYMLGVSLFNRLKIHFSDVL